MNIVIPIKLVPDLVEELSIDDSGAALDLAWSSLIISEFDDHAIEQGILLKESGGGQVTVIAPDVAGADDTLFTAAAKGADRLIKLSGAFETGVNNHALACAFAAVVKLLQPGLVLTGVQAHDDLDGSVGSLLAAYLGLPYVGYVSGVKVSDGQAIIRKEYPGGLLAEMAVTLPAVLGIQAASQPPRYVAFSKVRQATQTATVEEQEAVGLDSDGGLAIGRMYKPESGQRATMLDGSPDDIAARLVGIFQEIGVV